MAQVWLRVREYAGGELPDCCVVCGGGEDVEHLDREMEYRPSWPLAFLGLHAVGWPLLGAALGWFSERYNQVVPTTLPYCSRHYAYWEWRDRRQHVGALILAIGWLGPMLVTFAINNNMRMGPKAIAVAATATVVGLALILSCGAGVRLAGVKKTRFLFAGVPPDFVDAVERHRDDAE